MQSFLEVFTLRQDVELALGVASVRPVAVIRRTNHCQIDLVLFTGRVEPSSFSVVSPAVRLPLVDVYVRVLLERLNLVDPVYARDELFNSSSLVKAVCSGRGCQKTYFTFSLGHGFKVFPGQIEVASAQPQISSGHLE